MSGETPLIVNAEWLKSEMDSGNSRVKVLDASFSRQKDYAKEFHNGHIPGASYFSITHKVTNTDDYPSNIASTEDFQEYARSLGVNNDSHVVVYDNSGDGGFYFGGRAWYLFKLFGLEKVSVLDNGMHDWVDKGYPITKGESKPERGNFIAKRREDLYTRFKDMEENLTTKKYQVFDSRGAALYKGDPKDPRSGHYPGAFSVPFGTQLLDPKTGRFKTPEQFKQMYAEMGVDLKKPVVASCRTGMSACSLMMSLQLAGAEQFSMYHGSATEWCRNAKLENIERS